MTAPDYTGATVSKGHAYSQDKVASYSYYNTPIDNSPGRIAGNSHVWGDATPEVQTQVINILVNTARQFGLNGTEVFGDGTVLANGQTAAITTTPNAALAGGIQAQTGSFTKTDGTTSILADINLTQDTWHSRYIDQLAVPVELQNLPNISGMGRLRDLQQAAVLSPALATALTQYTATTSIQHQSLSDTALGRAANDENWRVAA